MEQPAPHPASTVRVALLGLLGYGVLLVTVLVLAAACGALVLVLLTGKAIILVVKLAAILVPLLWFIVRSMWVRIPPPRGLPLAKSDAPQLFALVERVRRTVAAPRIHSVLLTEDLNAGVAHVPWLGLFGPGRTYLVLGLPLLQALPESQLEAVLAHEFGHVSGKHSHFGAWVYRSRLTWARLAAGLRGTTGASPLRAFVAWYVPRFDAMSLVLARAQELQADRFSAEVSGARNAADALIATRLQGRLLRERFWTALARKNGRALGGVITYLTSKYRPPRCSPRPGPCSPAASSRTSPPDGSGTRWPRPATPTTPTPRWPSDSAISDSRCAFPRPGFRPPGPC